MWTSNLKAHKIKKYHSIGLKGLCKFVLTSCSFLKPGSDFAVCGIIIKMNFLINQHSGCQGISRISGTWNISVSPFPGPISLMAAVKGSVMNCPEPVFLHMYIYHWRSILNAVAESVDWDSAVMKIKLSISAEDRLIDCLRLPRHLQLHIGPFSLIWLLHSWGGMLCLLSVELWQWRTRMSCMNESYRHCIIHSGGRGWWIHAGWAPYGWLLENQKKLQKTMLMIKRDE